MTPIASPGEAPPAPTLVLAPRDQARREQAAEKARNAAQALDTLKRARKNVGQDRKAAAKQKLDALKHRLQQLRMLGATPGQLAQIAKELAAAVKAYASAGGSGLEAGPTQVAPTSAQPAASEGEAEPPPESEPSAESKEAKAATPYDKALRALQDDSARMARNAESQKEDREFISEARRLAKALKAAAAEAERRARQSGDPTAADDAKKAAAQAEEAVVEAERALQESAGGVTLSV